MIYTLAFSIHVYISALTLLSGIVCLVMAGQGRLKGRGYSSGDRWSAGIFIAALYMQLLLGFLIYYLLRASLEGELWQVPSMENDASLRFWAIEHIALMLFALFMSQLGWIFIRKSTQSERKYRASLFYYGTSMLLILFSVGIALLR